MTISILLVDDHPVVRDGLRGMLDGTDDLSVVGEAADGLECLAMVEHLNPDVILLDLNLPNLDGVGTLERLGAQGFSGATLVLSVRDGHADVRRAMRAGAAGYLLKDITREGLVDGVRKAASGGVALSSEVMHAAVLGADAGADLTTREVEVLTLVAEGCTNRAVGGRLNLSEATVKSHLVRAYEKLGVGDRASAVRRLHELGYL